MVKLCIPASPVTNGVATTSNTSVTDWIGTTKAEEAIELEEALSLEVAPVEMQMPDPNA